MNKIENFREKVLAVLKKVLPLQSKSLTNQNSNKMEKKVYGELNEKVQMESVAIYLLTCLAAINGIVEGREVNIADVSITFNPSHLNWFKKDSKLASVYCNATVRLDQDADCVVWSGLKKEGVAETDEYADQFGTGCFNELAIEDQAALIRMMAEFLENYIKTF